MADNIDDLKKKIDSLNDQLDNSKKRFRDLTDSGKSIQALTDSFDKTRESIKTTNGAAGDLFANLVGTSNAVTSTMANLSRIFLGTTQTTSAFAGQVQSLAAIISATLSPELGKLVSGVGAISPAFDALTGTTRQLKRDTFDLSSTYGLSYDQVIRKTLDYQNSVLLANQFTFEGIDAVRKAAINMAQYGLSIDEVTQTFDVAGTKQNLLSEGFLIATDSGIDSSKVFQMMAASVRTMGYDVETSSKPLVALESIARNTGLPLTQIGEKVFRTAQEFARLGLTVDGMAPIIQRFTDNLGAGFKGLAVDEVNRLMQNLTGQINTTNAAFIAMQGGLARPGAGVAEAQLDFEDAFKNPVEIMKSLTSTLAGVTGGKIIKFEEARANPELANQFKLQRDLLAQLTGNRDPQSQRTLLSILADLQSGRQLSSAQQATLEDVMKSGQEKQNEMASSQQQLDRISVGLQTETNIILGNMLNRLFPAQVQGELARKAGGAVATGAEDVIGAARVFGDKIGQIAAGKGVDLGALKEKYAGLIASQARGPGIGAAPAFGTTISPFAPSAAASTFVSAATTTATHPIPFAPSTAPLSAAPTLATAAGEAGKTAITNAATIGATNITITFKSTDELGRILASIASAKINNTNHGG
jgi:hypothetical protein